MLKVWVPSWFFCFLFFFLFYFGLYLKSGHDSLSAGRPLLVIQLSRDNKTSEQKTFFPALFLWRLFFHFSTTETRRFNEDHHGLCLDRTIERRKPEIETGKLPLEITYLMSVDYLLLF